MACAWARYMADDEWKEIEDRVLPLTGYSPSVLPWEQG
jgi:hypothetical protein